MGDIIKVDGEEYCYVPCEAEACGLSVIQNCGQRWKECVPFRLNNPGQTLPKDKKYHVTKWSDSNESAKHGGGWGAEAFQVYESHVKMIEEARHQDEENGYELQKLARKACRVANGPPGEIPSPEAKEKEASNSGPNLAPHQGKKKTLEESIPTYYEPRRSKRRAASPTTINYNEGSEDESG